MQDEVGCQEAEGPGEAQELKQVVHEQVVSSQSVQHCSKYNPNVTASTSTANTVFRCRGVSYRRTAPDV